MTEADDSRDRDDELWDPGAQRRAVLAMTMEERLDLLDALCRQLGSIELRPAGSA